VSELVVVVTAKAKPGKGAELLDAFGELAAATHEEDGCIAFAVHRAHGDHDTIALVERWASREALDGHLAATHLAAFRRDSAELFAEPSVIVVAEPIPAGNPAKGLLAGG
jgi:quinol monooxygenase YgiN